MSMYVPIDDGGGTLPVPTFQWPLKVPSRERFLKFIDAHFHEQEMSFVEIGVLKGDFSRMILDIICPKHLVLIDPFTTSEKSLYGNELNNLPTSYSDEKDYAEVLNRFSKEVVSGQIITSPKYSYESVSDWPDSFFDIVYHDASHKYEDIKRDLNDWLPKLKPQGLMCGHDYIEHEGFGVIQAVDEFCKEHGFEMILLNTDGGDYALKRK